jgi:hypothetical protein
MPPEHSEQNVHSKLQILARSLPGSRGVAQRSHWGRISSAMIVFALLTAAALRLPSRDLYFATSFHGT